MHTECKSLGSKINFEFYIQHGIRIIAQGSLVNSQRKAKASLPQNQEFQKIQFKITPIPLTIPIFMKYETL